MSPRHFAAYAKQYPKQYQAFSDNMWNGFVSITKHVPIVGRFFSFSPAEFLPQAKSENKITMEQISSPYLAFLPGDEDETPNPL